VIHDYISTDRKMLTTDFVLPKKSYADGTLELRFTALDGERGVSVAEIWILKQPPACEGGPRRRFGKGRKTDGKQTSYSGGRQLRDGFDHLHARISGFRRNGAGHEVHHRAGRQGANQAVQAARLGADVTMVGKVGRDASATADRLRARAGIRIGT
jgi:hypothetical protein